MENTKKQQKIKLELVRAKAQIYLPVVMTLSEVSRVIANMGGTHLLMSKILYGWLPPHDSANRSRVLPSLRFTRPSSQIRR